jgi:hypothetical protein
LIKLASRRRRRKSIGKVVTDVERRVRRVEKRPGATRLKRNVVTGEKIQYRAIPTKAIQADAITANEAEFGTTFVTTTEPTDYLKEGTTWFDPSSGTQSVYDPASENFIEATAIDATARASADGKNTIYRQDSQPSGGTYVTGDVWFDTDDDNKIYRYNSATSTWVGFTLGNNALASISANKITAGTIDASVITVSNLDAGNITTGTLTGRTISGGTITGAIINLAGTNSYGTFTLTNVLRYGSPSLTWGPTATPSFEIYQFGGGTGTIIQADGLSGDGQLFIGGKAKLELQGYDISVVYTGSPYPVVHSQNGLKNIKGTSTAGTPTGGADGDIVLVYTP